VSFKKKKGKPDEKDSQAIKLDKNNY